MNPFARKPGVKLDAEVDPCNHFIPRGFSRDQIIDSCGYIPSFLTHIEDGQTAQECFKLTYAHGGGWQPYGMEGVERWKADENGTLHYPEDPPFIPYVKIKLEKAKQDVFIYAHGVVMVRNADGSFEVARLD